jgi:folate-dependent phosphoribosylglycinamide formyltransferase PurN
VIAQRSFARAEAATVEQAEKRIHRIEHDLYPDTILKLLGDPS